MTGVQTCALPIWEQFPEADQLACNIASCDDERYGYDNHHQSEAFSDFEHQVNWELEHLEKADLIIMNILASSKSPITLLEMGLHMRSGKLHVICEPGFYRYDNVRITCNRYGVPLYHSMDEFLKTVR